MFKVVELKPKKTEKDLNVNSPSKKRQKKRKIDSKKKNKLKKLSRNVVIKNVYMKSEGKKVLK